MLIQVTGLPRSGTGFASMVLALNSRCLSYHELAYYNPHGWKLQLQASQAHHKYVADCSTYGFMKGGSYPCDKRILIYSTAEDSFERSRRIAPGITLKAMEGLYQQMLDYKEKYNPTTILRADLFKCEKLVLLWREVFESEPPALKLAELCKMNIQHVGTDKMVKANFVI